jgi:hypothetical protein
MVVYQLIVLHKYRYALSLVYNFIGAYPIISMVYNTVLISGDASFVGHYLGAFFTDSYSLIP